VSLLLFSLGLATAPAAAPAAAPAHAPLPGKEIGGFDHPCGTAVDSQGDVYVSSAGESKVRVFNASHSEVGSFEDTHEPCGLAVAADGAVFVSEAATGDIVRYAPNAYPLAGSPTYSATVVDGSGNAKGIAIDPSDGRLFVAEGNHVAIYEANGTFETNVGGGTLTEATGVAAYTSPTGDRYLFVADPAGLAADRVYVFSGKSLATLHLRRELSGPEAGQAFGFGGAGAYVAADPGVGSPTPEKCAEQACTAGHFFVYDDAHEAVDEFDASGEFLDQLTSLEFEDAQPTGLAVDRSGGSNDGILYVTVGSGPGGRLLAFSPLAPPSRPELPPPLSMVLANARAVAVDSVGDIYVAADTQIHIFDPSGKALTTIEDTERPNDLAVDSTGKLYVLDRGPQGLLGKESVTYYTPDAYPPTETTKYSRHEPIATLGSFPDGHGAMESIGLNPANDHLFVAKREAGRIIEFGSAAEGSPLLESEFGAGIIGAVPEEVDIYGRSGNVYVAEGGGTIRILNPTGTEAIARIDGSGGPRGPLAPNPTLAVDQANGHVVAFESSNGAAREYDAAGAFVAEFGKFTEGLIRPYRIALDNSNGANRGNVYVAFDDSAKETFDVTAFGPLVYGERPVVATGPATGLGEGEATLTGSVDPRGFEVTGCRFLYTTEADFRANGFGGVDAKEAQCEPGPAQIGQGASPVPVAAQIGGLDPGARYDYVLLAENGFGLTESPVRLFGPPAATILPAQPVIYGEAILRGVVDPSGIATEYHFEYGTTEAYGSSTPVELLAAPAETLLGEGESAVQAPIEGLQEGTVYHYRLVASNEAGSVTTVDSTFTTLARRPQQVCPNAEFRKGASAGLPDCRAYELVTPADTRGSTPFAAGVKSGQGQFSDWLVAPSGANAGRSAFFFINGTGLPGFEGNGRLDGYKATRGAEAHPASGWGSDLAGPTYAQAGGTQPRQHGVAADQQFSFWAVEPGEGLPGALAAGTYLRTPSGFEPIGAGTHQDLKAEGDFVSAGGTHVIFDSTERVEDAAPPQGIRAIYDRAAGEGTAHLVSVDPNGAAFGEDATYVGATEDGTTVLFDVGGALYARRAGQTYEVAASPNVFAGVSTDGTRVFFAGGSSGEAPNDLFACDIGSGPCAGSGSGAHAPTLIAPSSIFVNVSADGSRVYFTSEEVLDHPADEGELGQHNLYSWDGSAVTFVAALSSQDLVNFANSKEPINLARWTAAVGSGLVSGRALSPTRSSPNGAVLAFQSHAQLTSFDNDGKGEIYRYDADAPSGKRIVCVSCDPGGGAPTGDALLQSTRDITGTAPAEVHTMIPNLTENGGEIVFESADSLLPEDVNGVRDVYEWQAQGVDGCTPEEGCLALISTGKSAGPSFLYGMTPNGSDVFLSTSEKLVGRDIVGSPSIYDARVGGGIPEPGAPTVCEGDGCQGAGSAPPNLPSPSSNASGEGNVRPRAHHHHRRKHRHRRRHRRHGQRGIGR
jgi:sugar lactone lactonase YvrE